MPYPNEHACRLNDPGKYDRFARKKCEQKHDGKCIDVIYGIKGGKTEIQALRYPKSIWTASAAKSHCSGRGGSFEAAATRDEPPEVKVYEFKSVELKEEGKFRAVFATLGEEVEDAHGDITLPGAFGEQSVIISQYNHGSWDRGVDALPIGVGKIREEGNEAIVEGEFDMSDEAAVKTYKKIKYLTEKGRRQEWSYALPEIDYEYREQDGHRVRVLKRIKVNEVSPVLMGAGVNTRLLSVKSGSSMQLVDHAEVTVEAVSVLVDRLKSVVDLRDSEGKRVADITLGRFRALKARLVELVKEIDRVAESHDAVVREATRFYKTLSERREAHGN